MYKLVALDMDGTMLNGDRELSDRVKLAIQQVRKKGVKVVLSSGRNFNGIKRFIDKLGLDELVMNLNGALVYDSSGENLVFSESIDSKACKSVIEICEECGAFVILFIGKEAYVDKYTKEAEFFENHDKVKVTPVGMLSKFYTNQPAAKLMMVGENVELQRIRTKIQSSLGDKTNVAFSLPYFLEVYSSKISKGLMLQKVAEYYGIKTEEVIAMGDGENDLSMIEYAGLGIAMGNAMESVKKRADFITKSNTEDGVAYALEKFILNGECK